MLRIALGKPHVCSQERCVLEIFCFCVVFDGCEAHLSPHGCDVSRVWSLVVVMMLMAVAVVVVKMIVLVVVL